MTVPFAELSLVSASVSADANDTAYPLLPVAKPVTLKFSVELDWFANRFAWQSTCCAVTLQVPIDQLAELACSPALRERLSVTLVAFQRRQVLERHRYIGAAIDIDPNRRQRIDHKIDGRIDRKLK